MGAILGEFAAWIASFAGTWGGWFASGLLARVLTGAGLSLAYFTGLHAILSTLSGWVVGYGGAPAALVDILNLMGVGTSFQIMLAAYGVRVTMLSIHKVMLTQ